MKLKPNTSYSFSELDLQFVLELAKVGHVNLLSSQVSLISKNSNDPSISFKDYSSNENICDGLQLPDNWVVEWIGFHDSCIKITFGVGKLKPKTKNI